MDRLLNNYNFKILYKISVYTVCFFYDSKILINILHKLHSVKAKNILNSLYHATIKVGETELMISDTFQGQPHSSGNQVTICISTDNAEKAKQMFDALKKEGQVTMPLQETFFSPAYGSVIDKFGVSFQIHTEGQH